MGDKCPGTGDFPPCRLGVFIRREVLCTSQLMLNGTIFMKVCGSAVPWVVHGSQPSVLHLVVMFPCAVLFLGKLGKVLRLLQSLLREEQMVHGQSTVDRGCIWESRSQCHLEIVEFCREIWITNPNNGWDRRDVSFEE